MKKRGRRLTNVLLVIVLLSASSVYSNTVKSFEYFADKQQNIMEWQNKLDNEKEEKNITDGSTVNEKTDKEYKSVLSGNNSITNKYIFPSEDPVRAKLGSDNFVVRVNISEQKVHVVKDGIEIKTMDCSTGLPGEDSDTPLGKYKINEYFGQSFYSGKYKQGARYWVGFIGAEFLFHSVPTGENGQVIQEEADKIGIRASHGCIRLSIEDSFWFYETVPKGADVIIEK